MSPFAKLDVASERITVATADVAAASRNVTKQVTDAATTFSEGIRDSVSKISKMTRVGIAAFVAVALVAVVSLFMSISTRKLVTR